MQKINSRGFAHFFLLAFFVVGVAIVGTYKSISDTSMVASSSAKPAELSCTINLASTVKSGSSVRPSVTVKNTYAQAKQVHIEGEMGSGNKGGGFNGDLNVKAKRSQTFRSTNSLTAGAPGSDVGVSAVVTTSDGIRVVCSDGAKVTSSGSSRPVAAVSCLVNLASTVRSGSTVKPVVTIKNPLAQAQNVKLTGSIGSSSKGGNFTGNINVKAKRSHVFRSTDAFTAGSDGSTVRISVSGVTSSGQAFTCNDLAKVKGTPVAAKAAPALTCRINLASTVKSGSNIKPSVTIKNSFNQSKTVHIEGEMGTENKGGGFNADTTIRPKSSRTITFQNTLKAGAPGSKIGMSAVVTTTDGLRTVCEDGATVRS